MCCAVSGKLALSKRASITASLLYNLPKPQATIGVCRGSCVILQCFQRNDNSESLSFCKYETNIWYEHLHIQPNRNMNVLQQFNQYLYNTTTFYLLYGTTCFDPSEVHNYLLVFEQMFILLTAQRDDIKNQSFKWHTLTCSGFFFFLTNSSRFGMVPPSQPMLQFTDVLHNQHLHSRQLCTQYRTTPTTAMEQSSVRPTRVANLVLWEHISATMKPSIPDKWYPHDHQCKNLISHKM